jgi:hypothetical protein
MDARVKPAHDALKYLRSSLPGRRQQVGAKRRPMTGSAA